LRVSFRLEIDPMTMRPLLLTVFLALSLSVGCAPKEDPKEYARKLAKEVDGPREPSKITKLSVPVPVGKKVACEDWVDLAAFTEAIGDEVSLKDKSASEVEPTSVCSFVRGGDAVDVKAQEKAFLKNDMKLGVLPGDEYCLAQLYCSYANSEELLRKKCTGMDKAMNESGAGQPACVLTTQRASEYAYTYEAYDSDSKCTVRILGGPSVTDEQLVQRCTRAALTSVTAQGITSFK